MYSHNHFLSWALNTKLERYDLCWQRSYSLLRKETWKQIIAIQRKIDLMMVHTSVVRT